MEGFAKKLVSSDGSVRDKAFKTFKVWFLSRFTEIDEKECLRLWKALFYCMWMADRPTFQRNLALRLGDLWLEMYQSSPLHSLRFYEAFWITLVREWSGIDRLRLDKFYFLVKRFYLAAFEAMAHATWNVDEVERIMTILGAFPMSADKREYPDGIKMHCVEYLVPTLQTVLTNTESTLTSDVICAILKPYIELLARNEKPPLLALGKKMSVDLKDILGDGSAVQEVANAFMKRGEVEEIAQTNRRALYTMSQTLKEQ